MANLDNILTNAMHTFLFVALLHHHVTGESKDNDLAII